MKTFFLPSSLPLPATPTPPPLHPHLSPFFPLVFCFVLGLPSLKYCPSYPWSSLRRAVCLVASVVSSFVTPLTVASQAPLSMAFYRQEYWSGFPFPTPKNLLDLGIEPRSPVFPAFQADSLPTEPLGKSRHSQERAEACLIYHL